MAVVFTEEQSLARLAEEVWLRKGRFLATREAFMPEAVNQYADALSKNIKTAIKFRTEPSIRWGGPSEGRTILLNGDSAEKLFAQRGLSLNLSEQTPSGGRDR